MIPKPRPWKDHTIRKSLWSSLIGGLIVAAAEWWILGLWVMVVIVLVYYVAVPFSMTHGYKVGYRQGATDWPWTALRDEWIDRATWQRAVVIEGETGDTPRDPSQPDPRQLP
jgi:hypothetical protein